MAGKLTLISAEQTKDSNVRATFVYKSDGPDGDELTFTETLPGDADRDVISKQLIERCRLIAKGQPVPAFFTLKQLFPAGVLVAIPDAPA